MNEGTGSVGKREALPPTRWWWIRHAKVAANHGCVYGQTDLPCVVENEDSLPVMARLLPANAVWVVSNLQRTHQTARALIHAGAPGPVGFPGPDAYVEPDFAEQHFGAWQGVAYTKLAEHRGARDHRHWLGLADERPAGGESFVDLMKRAIPAIDRFNATFSGRDIVAVAHGGTIRAALARALGLAAEPALALRISNLSLTRLDWFDDDSSDCGHGWRVGCVNQIY
jgi:broad specificity phosphatase PhoE